MLHFHFCSLLWKFTFDVEPSVLILISLLILYNLGGVQLICNNMVTSTRAIVNTARSMVSTIMKFLDSGPNKAVDSTLKTRILASEPDNAEGIHNFAPLGKKSVIKSYVNLFSLLAGMKQN